jgi:hypothetical protein
MSDTGIPVLPPSTNNRQDATAIRSFVSLGDTTFEIEFVAKTDLRAFLHKYLSLHSWRRE